MTREARAGHYAIRIVYKRIVILSFADNQTERFFKDGVCPAKAPWQGVAKIAARKLDMLDAAPKLETLRSPPGNHLEALKHDRQGQHSICINDQWRICFVWTEGGATEVEITDYHY